MVNIKTQIFLQLFPEITDLQGKEREITLSEKIYLSDLSLFYRVFDDFFAKLRKSFRR